MKATFAGKHFRSIFLVSSLSLAVEYLAILSNNIIAGQILGERALAAISLVMPFFESIIFFSYLVGIGTQVVNALAVGEGNRKYANQLFSLGVSMAAGVGILLTGIFLFVYFNFSAIFSPAPELASLAKEYFLGMCFLPILEIMNALLFCIIINEGGENICLVGSITQLVSGIVFSVALCFAFGIEGISIGTVLSNILTLIILCLYFRSPKNMLRFAFYFKLKDVIRIMKYSANEASAYLYLAALTFFLNSYVISNYGETGITILAVVLNVLSLLHAAFDGFGDALSGLLNTYQAEGNLHGIKKTMDAAMSMALMLALALCVFIELMAPFIPGVLGIREAEIVSMSVTAVRIFTFSAVPMAFLSVYVIYYTYMNRIALGVLINTLYLLVVPIAMIVLFGMSGSLVVIWLGFAVSYFISVLVSALMVRFGYKKLTFPLLIDPNRIKAQLSYDVPQTKEGIMSLVYTIENDLTKLNIEREKIIRMLLMIEESQMLSLERSNVKDGVIECCILFEERITMILKDSGGINDVTDQDGNILSDRSYLAMSILGGYRQKQYLLTSGANRTLFYF